MSEQGGSVFSVLNAVNTNEHAGKKVERGTSDAG